MIYSRRINDLFDPSITFCVCFSQIKVKRVHCFFIKCLNDRSSDLKRQTWKCVACVIKMQLSVDVFSFLCQTIVMRGLLCYNVLYVVIRRSHLISYKHVDNKSFIRFGVVEYEIYSASQKIFASPFGLVEYCFLGWINLHIRRRLIE